MQLEMDDLPQLGACRGGLGRREMRQCHVCVVQGCVSAGTFQGQNSPSCACL